MLIPGFKWRLCADSGIWEEEKECASMAFGGLRVLSSILVLVLYIRNLVAIVDKNQPELQG